MKLAAWPKFVLHGGAMMRNMAPDVHRFTPFQNIIIQGASRRDSIKISICFNGCSPIWRNGFDFGEGKTFVIRKMPPSNFTSTD